MAKSQFRGGSGTTPSGLARQSQHALGVPADERPWYDYPEYESYNKIPQKYVVNITLSGDPDAQPVERTTDLQPPPFLLRRITYATTGDLLTLAQVDDGADIAPFPPYSQQARSVEMEWGDEFTRFMGKTPGLVAAILGDSNGFLDLPVPALFQGSQVLFVRLNRLFWPLEIEEQVNIPEVDTLWDFYFDGVLLLPKDTNQSGSE